MQNLPIQGTTGPKGPQPVIPSSQPQAAAFRALLDQLESQARGLAASSETVQDAAGLNEAVGQSERALEHARELSDQLLEAFRASQQRHSA